jgi:hypothetical protein
MRLKLRNKPRSVLLPGVATGEPAVIVLLSKQ